MLETTTLVTLALVVNAIFYVLVLITTYRNKAPGSFLVWLLLLPTVVALFKFLEH